MPRSRAARWWCSQKQVTREAAMLWAWLDPSALRSGPFRSLKNRMPSNVVGRAQVRDQSGPEGAHARVEEAERAGLLSFQVHFGESFTPGTSERNTVFHRAEAFHAPLPGLGQDGGHDVQAAVVRGAGLLQWRMAIKLSVRRGVIAAVEEFHVRFLRPMVGKGMAWNLPPSQASTVGEGRQKEGVCAGALLEDVERLAGAFVHERDGANLDADRLAWRRRWCGVKRSNPSDWPGGSKGSQRGGVPETSVVKRRRWLGVCSWDRDSWPQSYGRIQP